jgi:cysteine synthase A
MSSMRYVNSMLELIGNTPLLKLNKIGGHVRANVFVKLEFLNPSGSYKDRMAIAMVEAAEKGLTWNGRTLQPGGVVCDASAGNTAPALAFVAAVKGYKAKLGIYRTVLRGASTRLKITGAYGPEVRECRPPTEFVSEESLEQLSPADGELAWVIAGKMDMAEQERLDPDLVWVDQIYNKFNYIGLMDIGREIYDQLDGRVDAWGCAVGSGGTMLGTALAFEEKGVRPWTFGIVPVGSEAYLALDKPHSARGDFRTSEAMRRLAGLMGLTKWETEKSIVEVMVDKGYPDEFFQVSAEEARDMANRLAREEGIYCGMSSGANVAVAMKVAERMQSGQNVVTVIVDRRDRYLGEYPEDVFVV